MAGKMTESFRPQSIRTGIVINAIARVFHSLFGFLLFVFIAQRFGADFSTDGFLVTNSLIGLFLLAGESMVGVTLVPVYIEYHEKRGPEEAQEFFNCLFSSLFVCLAVISLLILICSSWIAFVLAPGFSGEAHVVTANLMRISSPLVLLVGVTGMSSSMFYVGRSFTIPALTSSFLVLGQVSFLFLLEQSVGIYSVQIGAVVGVVCQAVALVYFLKRRGTGPRFSWNPRHPGIKQVVGLLMPRFVGMATTRINIVVDRLFASLLEAGFVSALAYSYRVIQVPGMLIMEAVAKTLVPVLSKHDSQGEPKEIREKLYRVLRGLNFFLIPMMVIFFILREPLVSALFQRGAFGREATLLTARALLFYDIGLLAYSYNIALHIVYYSIQDTATPMKIGVGAMMLNAVLDMVLIRFMGMEGIALATSVVAFVRTGVLLAFLKFRIGLISYLSIMKSIARFSLASVPMGIAAWWMSRSVGSYLNTPSMVGSMVQVGTAVLVGGVAYLGVFYVMNMDEGREILQFVGRKPLV
jgi:putative peptidoglycan lipid II flippase